MSDSLKPVNCGCGGEVWAFMTLYPENTERPYICQCRNCFTRTGGYPTKAEAVTAWNKAMGYRIGKWIEWKATNGIDSGIECSECGYKCNAYPGYGSAFCPTCGAEMTNE